MKDSPAITLYHSENECAFFPERTAYYATAPLAQNFNQAGHDSLAENERKAALYLSLGMFPTLSGFRKKTCAHCHSCLPVRIPLPAFKPSREHRATLQKNSNLEIVLAVHNPCLTNDQKLSNAFIDLYQLYKRSRFDLPSGGEAVRHLHEKALISFHRFCGMTAQYLLAFDKTTGQLAGSLIYHLAEQATYGTQFFYDPAYRGQGIGHFMILNFLEKTKKDGMEHAYLGDWSREATGLSWKSKYAPLEVLQNGAWSACDIETLRAMRLGAGPIFPPKRNLAPS